MLFEKVRFNGSWLNLSANTSETLFIVKIFICLCSMTVCTLILCPLQICNYINIFVSLPFPILLVLLRLFLINLQNILKLDFSATKTEDHQLAKRVLQVISIHVSRLLCCWHSWHISKSVLIIRQIQAVPVELVGKLDN